MWLQDWCLKEAWYNSLSARTSRPNPALDLRSTHDKNCLQSHVVTELAAVDHLIAFAHKGRQRLVCIMYTTIQLDATRSKPLNDHAEAQRHKDAYFSNKRLQFPKVGSSEPSDLSSVRSVTSDSRKIWPRILTGSQPAPAVNPFVPHPGFLPDVISLNPAVPIE